MPSLFANAAIRSHYRRRSDGQAAAPRERLLLDLIRRAGQCERSDLPRASGLSVPGIKGIIDRLWQMACCSWGPRCGAAAANPARKCVWCRSMHTAWGCR